jgi:hypothetical protein
MTDAWQWPSREEWARRRRTAYADMNPRPASPERFHHFVRLGGS